MKHVLITVAQKEDVKELIAYEANMYRKGFKHGAIVAIVGITIASVSMAIKKTKETDTKETKKES